MNNCSTKILMTGGNGQVATALKAHPLANKFHLLALTHTELNISSPVSIETAIKHFRPQIIINTAAYTAVDKAEEEKEQAITTNHLGVQYLATIAQQYRIKLIHLSTDYVFDGRACCPYTEKDDAHPINVYGQSKWLGEEALRQTCEDYLILRVSAVFSEYGHNFLKTMLKLAKEKKALRVIADQITCPTSAEHIADVLFMLATEQTAIGTYHFCSNHPVSWYEFAKIILPQENISAISTHEYPTIAKRPAYSVLNCSKIKNDFNISQPFFEDAVKKIYAKLST